MSAACPPISKLLKKTSSILLDPKFSQYNDFRTSNEQQQSFKPTVSHIDVILIDPARKTPKMLTHSSVPTDVKLSRNTRSETCKKTTDSRYLVGSSIGGLAKEPSRIALALRASENGKHTLILEGIEEVIMDLCIHLIYCQSFRIKKSQILDFVLVARSLEILGSESICQELEMSLMGYPVSSQMRHVPACRSNKGTVNNRSSLQRKKAVTKVHSVKLPKNQNFRAKNVGAPLPKSRNQFMINSAFNRESHFRVPLVFQPHSTMTHMPRIDKLQEIYAAFLPIHLQKSSVQYNKFSITKSPLDVLSSHDANNNRCLIESGSTHFAGIYGACNRQGRCSSFIPTQALIQQSGSVENISSQHDRIESNHVKLHMKSVNNDAVATSHPSGISANNSSVKRSLDGLKDDAVEQQQIKRCELERMKLADEPMNINNRACDSKAVEVFTFATRTDKFKESEPSDGNMNFNKCNSLPFQEVGSDTVKVVKPHAREQNTKNLGKSKTCLKLPRRKPSTVCNSASQSLIDYSVRKSLETSEPHNKGLDAVEFISKGSKGLNRIGKNHLCCKRESCGSGFSSNIYPGVDWSLSKRGNVQTSKEKEIKDMNSPRDFKEDRNQTFQCSRSDMIDGPQNSYGDRKTDKWLADNKKDRDMVGCHKKNRELFSNYKEDEQLLNDQEKSKWIFDVDISDKGIITDQEKDSWLCRISETGEGLIDNQEENQLMPSNHKGEKGMAGEDGRNEGIGMVAENGDFKVERLVDSDQKLDELFTDVNHEDRRKGANLEGIRIREEQELGSIANDPLSLHRSLADNSFSYQGEKSNIKEVRHNGNCLEGAKVAAGNSLENNRRIGVIEENKGVVEHERYRVGGSYCVGDAISSVSPTTLGSIQKRCGLMCDDEEDIADMSNSVRHCKVTEQGTGKENIRAVVHDDRKDLNDSQIFSPIVKDISKIKTEKVDEQLIYNEDSLIGKYDDTVIEKESPSLTGDHQAFSESENMNRKMEMDMKFRLCEEYEFVSIAGTSLNKEIEVNLPTFKEEPSYVNEEFGSNLKNWEPNDESFSGSVGGCGGHPSESASFLLGPMQLEESFPEHSIQKPIPIYPQNMLGNPLVTTNSQDNESLHTDGCFLFDMDKFKSEKKGITSLCGGSDLNHLDNLSIDSREQEAESKNSQNVGRFQTFRTETEAEKSDLVYSESKQTEDGGIQSDMCSDTDSSGETYGADIYSYSNEREQYLWTPPSDPISPEIELSRSFLKRIGYSNNSEASSASVSGPQESRKEKEISSYRRKILESASSFHSKRVGNCAKALRNKASRRAVKFRQKKIPNKSESKTSLLTKGNSKVFIETEECHPSNCQNPLQNSNEFQVVESSETLIQDSKKMLGQKPCISFEHKHLNLAEQKAGTINHTYVSRPNPEKCEGSEFSGLESSEFSVNSVAEKSSFTPAQVPYITSDVSKLSTPENSPLPKENPTAAVCEDGSAGGNLSVTDKVVFFDVKKEIRNDDIASASWQSLADEIEYVVVADTGNKALETWSHTEERGGTLKMDTSIPVTDNILTHGNSNHPGSSVNCFALKTEESVCSPMMQESSRIADEGLFCSDKVTPANYSTNSNQDGHCYKNNLKNGRHWDDKGTDSTLSKNDKNWSFISHSDKFELGSANRNLTAEFTVQVNSVSVKIKEYTGKMIESKPSLGVSYRQESDDQPADVGFGGSSDGKVTTNPDTNDVFYTPERESDQNCEKSPENTSSHGSAKGVNECSLCLEIFRTEKLLVTHILEVHKKASLTRCPLPLCSVLVARNKVTCHMKHHLITRSFRCSTCSFSAKLLSALKKHEKSHKKVRYAFIMYSICNRCFVSLSGLERYCSLLLMKIAIWWEQ